MNLQELQENKKTTVVKRALREHYDMNINFDSLTMKQAQKMLGSVRNLLNDSRANNKVYESHNNRAYLKLVMMEQALEDRLNFLRSNRSRIVVENEEVQKSQVILAAQDMIDNVQKMIEQISKMNVEELNAVVDGMKNEFGTSAGDQYNQAVGQSLTTLQKSLTTAKTELTNALGIVTGDSSGQPADMTGMPGEEMPPSPEMPPEGEQMDIEAGAELEAPVEGPAPEDLTGAGRERR
jgi:hypothetical protein